MNPKEKWKRNLAQAEIPFETNKWGSAQYSSILWMYDIYFEMRKDLSRQDAFSLLGITILEEDIAQKAPMEDAIKVVIEFIEELQEEVDLGTGYQDDLKGYKNNLREGITSLDYCFDVLRNMAWDLWGATGLLGGMSFPEVKFTSSDGFQASAWLILLTEEGLVKEPDKAYEGFDT